MLRSPAKETWFCFATGLGLGVWLSAALVPWLLLGAVGVGAFLLWRQNQRLEKENKWLQRANDSLVGQNDILSHDVGDLTIQSAEHYGWYENTRGGAVQLQARVDRLRHRIRVQDDDIDQLRVDNDALVNENLFLRADQARYVTRSNRALAVMRTMQEVREGFGLPE